MGVCAFCKRESKWGYVPTVEGSNLFVCIRCYFVLPLKLFWVILKAIGESLWFAGGKG